MKNLSVAFLVILIISGCSAWDAARVARIAATGDIASAQRMAAEKAVRYAANPKALDRDIKRFQKDFAKLIETFRKTVGGVWGKEEIKEPGPRRLSENSRGLVKKQCIYE